MKRWEDFSMEDIKNYLSGLNRKSDTNVVVAIIAIIGIVALIATVVVAVVKLTNKRDDDFYDDFDDDDDAFYLDEDGEFED